MNDQHGVQLRRLCAHLIRAGLWDALEKTLLWRGFCEAKAQAHMVFGIVKDFEESLRALPLDRPLRPTLNVLLCALRRHAHFIDNHPTSLFQCLWNLCWWHDCPQGALRYGCEWSDASESVNPDARSLEVPRVHLLLEHWRAEIEKEAPGFVWCRSIRPPEGAPDARKVLRLTGHAGPVLCLAVSNDEKYVASAGADCTVRVWDIATGELRALFDDQQHQIGALAFSPDRTRLVIGSREGTVKVWAFDTEQPVLVRKTGRWTAEHAVSFSRDGTSFLAVSDGAVQCWDLNGNELSASDVTGAERAEGIELSHFGHTKRCLANGKTIVSGLDNGHILIHEPVEQTSTTALLQHRETITDMCFSRDGRYLVSAARHDTVCFVWDTVTGMPARIISHEGKPIRAVFLPDGKHIVTLALDGCVRICNVDGVVIECWPSHDVVDDVGMALSPDGKWIASWGDWSDHTIKLREVASGECRTLGTDLTVDHVAFSPDSFFLAACARDKGIFLWDSEDADLLGVLDGKMLGGVAQCAAFSPDGSRLAAGVGSDIGMWPLDRPTGELRLPGKEGTVRRLAFSADGMKVIAQSEWEPNMKGLVRQLSGTTNVWDATCLMPPRRIEGVLDIEAVAAGHRLQLVATARETVVQRSSDGESVAFFPEQLSCVRTHPSGRLWAGAVDNRLCLLQLEGDDQGPASNADNRFHSEPPRFDLPVKVTRTIPGGWEWIDHSHARHEAICPVCGRGKGFGSGDYKTDLIVYFGSGPPFTIERSIDLMRVQCRGAAVSEVDGESTTCTVGTGSFNGLYLLANQQSPWDRAKVIEYLRSIGSPLATHRSVLAIPQK